jgi:hypothetical protein
MHQIAPGDKLASPLIEAIKGDQFRARQGNKGSQFAGQR